MDLALNNLQRLICHKTHQTKPNQTILISHQFIFNFTSSLFRLLHLAFVSIAMLSPSCGHLCSYSLMRNDNAITISWAQFNFFLISHWLLIITCSAWTGNQWEHDGKFNFSRWKFLTNFIQTPESFWSLNCHYPMKELISDWPQVQSLLIKLIDSCIFPLV